MEREASLTKAKEIMGNNFIGVEEYLKISVFFSIKLPTVIPPIKFSLSELKEKKDDYILILGINEMSSGIALNLLNIRNFFGFNPEVSEPCFYNQDWYLKEEFMTYTLDIKWYLIKKNVFENSRGINPDVLKTKFNFPSAILCALTFFSYWLINNEICWEYDFIWCSDVDHNGDKVYVGKYVDIDGVNKNGFSIHRHLALRQTYAAITVQ